LTEQLVKNYENGIKPNIDPKRLDDAVLRVLKLKFETNLAKKPMPLELYNQFKEKFGSDEHRELAKRAAKESAVLLKGDKENLIYSQDSVLVIGEMAQNTGYQAGGWSLEWQGLKKNIPGSLSIWDGIQNQQEATSFDLEFSIDGKTNFRPNKIILVIGEEPYAEGMGDRTTNGPTLSLEHLELLKRAISFNVPVTVILLNGRPLLLPKEMDEVSSLISYWLPGTMGSAIADLLVGNDEFSGKLPFSWPASKGQIDDDYRNQDNDWQFPLGFGLN
jgi:beta-glucosidase